MSPELEKMLGLIENDIKAVRNLSKLISSPKKLDKIIFPALCNIN